MSEFKKARQDYESTPIPQELEDRVRAGIRQGKASYRRRRWRRIATGAAACFVVMVGTLNLSPTVAAAAAEVPVLGGLFRVMTFISYNASDGGINYVVSVPRLETDGESELARRVNGVVQEKVDAHMAKARQDWEDYKNAFFATGGTEEEWAGREMDVIVDYEVKSQTDSRVSFVVTLAEGWVASMEERYCYNLDLAENRDMEQEQFAMEVEKEIRGFAENSLRSQVSGYDSVQIRSKDMRITDPKWRYALMPVWTLTYVDKRTDKVYYLACNGQTGKVCGELPVDSGRLARLFASVFVPLFAVLLAVGYFL